MVGGEGDGGWMSFGPLDEHPICGVLYEPGTPEYDNCVKSLSGESQIFERPPIRWHTRRPDMAIPWGQVLGAVGGAIGGWIGSEAAGATAPVPAAQGPAPTWDPGVFGNEVQVPDEARGIWCFNPRTGRVWKKRYRRKRLATASDIKDVMAIKAALGPGAAKEIAMLRMATR